MAKPPAASFVRLRLGQKRGTSASMPILSRSRLIAFVLAVALGAAASLYLVQTRGPSSADNGQCRASAAAIGDLKGMARGEVAALAVNAAPKPPPVVSFTDADQQARTLADFKGRMVLVNLWATWCVPCREEMPALDKLQARFGGPAFQVVAINVDTRNADKPKAWLQQNGIRNLAYYADPTGKLLQVLQKSGHAVGLPTTLLVDASGCEIALLKGPAEWASPDAVAFIEAALKP
jgi:thiol-disulfide isomerase/thioredoxin